MDIGAAYHIFSCAMKLLYVALSIALVIRYDFRGVVLASIAVWGLSIVEFIIRTSV